MNTTIVSTYWHIGGGWYDIRVNGRCATVRGKMRAEEKAEEMRQQERRDVNVHSVYESFIKKGSNNE